MDRLNTLFKNNLRLIRFISILLVRVDTSTNRMWYCNAGHNPGLWLQSKSGEIQLLNPTGPAIGLTRDAAFTSQEIHFDSGDLFVFYTDGLIETKNTQSEEFGEVRLTAALQSCNADSAQMVLEHLVKSARDFAGKFHDDMTVMVIKSS
jgi:sigma-B regulation protein RsbU (phosphoserine phosphatase)